MLGMTGERQFHVIQTVFISPEKVRIYVGLAKIIIFQPRPVSFDWITAGKVDLSGPSNKSSKLVPKSR
jgi:hypothetical protein